MPYVKPQEERKRSLSPNQCSSDYWNCDKWCSTIHSLCVLKTLWNANCISKILATKNSSFHTTSDFNTPLTVFFLCSNAFLSTIKQLSCAVWETCLSSSFLYKVLMEHKQNLLFCSYILCMRYFWCVKTGKRHICLIPFSAAKYISQISCHLTTTTMSVNRF